MTNQEKAESYGEFVRDGLDALADPYSPATIVRNWDIAREHVVQGARQAGHWGRLALAQARMTRLAMDSGMSWRDDGEASQ